MPYLKQFAALVFALTLYAPAVHAGDEVMGPPWPPPVEMTSEDTPPAAAIPPDYPEDFSKPDTAATSTVHNAFGEDEDPGIPSSTEWGGEPQVSE